MTSWGYAGEIPADDQDLFGGRGRVVSLVAAEPIPPGRVVVLDPSGKLTLPRGPTLVRVAGVSLRHRSGRAWLAGEQVPVIRRGRVHVETLDASDSHSYVPGHVLGTPHLVQAKVWIGSSSPEDLGKVTAIGAESAVAGEEIARLQGTLDGAVYAGAILAEISYP